jgi:hypothetical protein
MSVGTTCEKTPVDKAGILSRRYSTEYPYMRESNGV